MRSLTMYFCITAIALVAAVVVGDCAVKGGTSCSTRSEDDAAMMQINRPRGKATDDAASLAHAGTDMHALKQGVIEKTKDFVEAMESLEESSKAAMEKDFT